MQHQVEMARKEKETMEREFKKKLEEQERSFQQAEKNQE